LLKYFDRIREIRLRISHAIDCRRKKQTRQLACVPSRSDPAASLVDILENLNAKTEPLGAFDAQGQQQTPAEQINADSARGESICKHRSI
jgi:hypothetical protein